MWPNHIQTVELDGQPGSQSPSAATSQAWLKLAKESKMREWHKPTIEETESGMEVTSYLPAELDRA
jgi:coenzyme PQQ precursor peptide PqqA